MYDIPKVSHSLGKYCAPTGICYNFRTRPKPGNQIQTQKKFIQRKALFPQTFKWQRIQKSRCKISFWFSDY